MDALRQVVRHETVDELALVRRQLHETCAELARVRDTAARALSRLNDLYEEEDEFAAQVNQDEMLVVSMTALRSVVQVRQHHRM